MSAAPSPPGWVIPNADAQAFSFTSTFNGVNSLSDQALRMDATASPRPVILPDNSPGNVSETRVEFAVMAGDATKRISAGIVFGFQDIENHLAFEAELEGFDDEVAVATLTETVNGQKSELASTGIDSSLPVNPAQEWVDIRVQVFRPSSGAVAFRADAADHGNSYQSLGTVELQDSELNFTSGDVGLTCGQVESKSAAAFDGDPVGSGGRPIKMYWA